MCENKKSAYVSISGGGSSTLFLFPQPHNQGTSSMCPPPKLNGLNFGLPRKQIAAPMPLNAMPPMERNVPPIDHGHVPRMVRKHAIAVLAKSQKNPRSGCLRRWLRSGIPANVIAATPAMTPNSGDKVCQRMVEIVAPSAQIVSTFVQIQVPTLNCAMSTAVAPTV